MGAELLRIVDAIHREKKIDKEIVLRGIRLALASAARKHYKLEEDTVIEINISPKGDISALIEGRTVTPEELGRIAAQTAKQVIIQKIREAEQDVIFEEYQERVGTLVIGTVQRFEGPNVVINLGKTEGVLPRSEQIYSESYQPGDRLRLYVSDVKRVGAKTRIIVSRTDPELVRLLFQMEIPEIAEGIIDMRSIAREAGYRTKVAVQSHDSKIDCVGACVGVRGSRIKSIVEELNGEKIDIVRWSDDPVELVSESLKPAKVGQIFLGADGEGATVVVEDAQLSLAIGRRGQNVRLASRLSGYDIDIVSKTQLSERASESIQELCGIPEIDEELALVLYREGYEVLQDLADAGEATLAAIPQVTPEKALEIMTRLRLIAEEYAKSADSDQEEDSDSTARPADASAENPAESQGTAPADATGDTDDTSQETGDDENPAT